MARGLSLSVTLPENLDTLDRQIQNRIEKCRAGILCPDTLREKAAELRRQAGWDGKGIIVASGHQPVIYHPGLFAKEVLAVALARRYDGSAYNIVLDTDEIDLAISYPVRLDMDFSCTTSVQDWPVHKRTVPLTRGNRIVGFQKFDDSNRALLRRACEEALRELHLVLEPNARRRARNFILEYIQRLEKANSILDPSIILRDIARQELGIRVTDVKASELFNSDAFRYFAAFVAERGADFRRAYNEQLAQYRAEHRIKNPAQPLPDLDEQIGELPFWYIKGGYREALTDDTFAEALQSCKDGSGAIYPRAVTTSLFVRLFFCDLFIHGTGGGRYDRITESLILKFFECDAAPFVVATASLQLEPRADVPVLSRDLKAVERELRQLHFDPARFLSTECELHRQREELIERWHDAKAAHRPRAELHREFAKLKRKARLYLHFRKKELEKERTRARRVAAGARIFGDRSYPLFYYDLNELSEAMKSIG